MASLRILRRRIRSIQNTKQIMRAMQLVSGSKFKRAQTQLMQSRAVLQFLDELIQRTLAAYPNVVHPLTQAHPGRPTAVVIVTSDTGLCGSYNTNLLQLAEATVRADGSIPRSLVFIGKKGHRHFAKRGYHAAGAHLNLAGRPDVATISRIGQQLMDKFLAGEIGGVQILHARFISAAVSKPGLQPWLPALVQPVPGGTRPLPEKYIFEPSPAAVFADLLPRWALAKFQLAILEAFTSEHGARMVAMKNATDNAEELLGSLTRERNRVRQASITREISEIVGTAEALS